MRLKTDREEYTDMLEDWGVAYTDEGNAVILKAQTDKVSGYIGFESWAIFDEDGNFIEFSIGE